MKERRRNRIFPWTKKGDPEPRKSGGNCDSWGYTLQALDGSQRQKPEGREVVGFAEEQGEEKMEERHGEVPP